MEDIIPSYIHTVAALQAQNAKMLRVVADIHDATGNTSAAAERRQQASAILAAVQERLYVQGQGVFATLYPSNASNPGKRVAVRTCLDFMYLPPLALNRMNTIIVLFSEAFQNVDAGDSDGSTTPQTCMYQ